MAQLYSTGPVEVHVGIGPSFTPTFLGHGRRAPRIRLRRRFRDVETDIGGAVAHDRSYGGEIAIITVDLVRYNESALAVIQDVAGATTAAPARGTNDPGEIGTLMVEENAAYPLWLRFPKFGRPAFARVANGAMPPGYRFLRAHLDDDDMETGWGARVCRLTWTCLRLFDPNVTGFDGSFGRFTLYDHDMTGLPPAT